MTQKKYDLTSKDVHNVALQVLCQLPLVARTAHGAYLKVTDFLNAVIFAAAFRLSVSQACTELKGLPCSSYILGELADQLHDLEQQQKVINQILASKLPKLIGKRGRRIAIDLVEVPSL